MDYIEKILGISVIQMQWEHFLKMPYYIQEKYEIKKAALDTKTGVL